MKRIMLEHVPFHERRYSNIREAQISYSLKPKQGEKHKRSRENNGSKERKKQVRQRRIREEVFLNLSKIDAK